MGRFGNVKRITASVGNREFTFRSKLEYRWAVWCELRKEQGLIQDWFYEDPETFLVLETKYGYCNKKGYLPDFCILYPNGHYEYEETKGYFPAKDCTKIRLAAEQYANPITLIFARLKDGSSNKKTREQYARAKKLEPHIKRIIWDADKSIFKKISYLFDK